MKYDFPRDPNSAFNQITSDAIAASVRKLVSGVPEVQRAIEDGHEKHLKIMLDGLGGWNIVEVLKTAVACGAIKGLTEDDYDFALVKQALIDSLANR
jgi:hypothetical protein